MDLQGLIGRDRRQAPGTTLEYIGFRGNRKRREKIMFAIWDTH